MNEQHRGEDTGLANYSLPWRRPFLLLLAVGLLLANPQAAEARKSHKHPRHNSGPVPVELPTLPSAIPAYAIRPGEILLLPDDSYYPTLLKYIEAAQERIDVAIYLFKISKSQKNRATVIGNSLVRARQRGVPVSVTLELSDSNQSLNRQNLETANFLQGNGVKVRFENPEITTHAKLLVIDRRYSFLGSHNLTDSALHTNREMSLLIDNRQIAYQLMQYIEGIR